MGAFKVKSGTGLLTVNVGTTRIGIPPGFATVTIEVPAMAMAAAGICACSNVGVLLLYVEVTGSPPKVTFEEAPNPVPVKVSVNGGPPAVALAGTIKLTVG